MLRDDIMVEVRDRTLKRRGQITTKYLKLAASLRSRNVGDWKLTLPGAHPMVAVLSEPGSGIVVSQRLSTGWATLFSGVTSLPTLARNLQNPDGTYTFEGKTDDQLLADARAYPQPSNADVSSQSVANDTRVGRAETVMRYYVSANIGPTAPSARKLGSLREYIALSQVDGARGPIVTKSPRFQNLMELLSEIALYSSLSFQLVQRGNALEFEVSSVRDRSRFVRFDIENGSLSSEQVQMTPPGVTRAIVAGQGEGAARTIIQRTSSASDTAEAEWGRIIERFIDQRNTNDLVELQQSGDEALIEEGFTATNVKVVPTDGTTMRFGEHWRLDDLVTIVVRGQETTAPVTEAVLLIDDTKAVIGAGFGDVRGFSRDDALTQRVEDTEQRVERLERTVELGGSDYSMVPVGAVQMFAGTAIPAGWLRCDGQSVLRSSYPLLFAALGGASSPWGGVTATHFNVPNMKGRVPVGLDTGDTQFDAVGETGGAKTHTLTVAEMPSHTHTQNAHTHTQDSHSHGPSGGGSFLKSGTGSGANITTGGGGYASTTVTTSVTPDINSTTATNQNTGGGGAHNNLQPYAVLDFIIRAA